MNPGPPYFRAAVLCTLLVLTAIPIALAAQETPGGNVALGRACDGLQRV